MADQKKKTDQPESPLAKAMRTGTLGGAKPTEKTEDNTPSKVEQEEKTSITTDKPASTNKDRRRLTGYIARDIYQWTKIRAATEDREISEIMEDALRLYKAKVQP